LFLDLTIEERKREKERERERKREKERERERKREKEREREKDIYKASKLLPTIPLTVTFFVGTVLFDSKS
jgi:hypothetical protein